MKFLKWLKFKFGKKEEEEEVKEEILLIPSSDYPDPKDWKLEFLQESYLRKLDAYYFYQIVQSTHSFAKGKESKETLITLTAKHSLIKQLLEK